jgi:hypothetical protein
MRVQGRSFRIWFVSYSNPSTETKRDFGGTDFTGCGKTQSAVILSEAKNLSLFLFLYLNRREIPRSAWNDKINYFFRSLFSQLALNLVKFGNCPQPERVAGKVKEGPVS